MNTTNSTMTSANCNNPNATRMQNLSHNSMRSLVHGNHLVFLRILLTVRFSEIIDHF